VNEDAQRVLIVDDEQAIRRLLRASLTARGYAVWEASTGEQALQAVPAARPGVIILDLGLPDFDGTEVTRILREWTQTPIIILSVRGQESDKIAALDAGADDYLTKPFGSGELLARIRAALRRANRVEERSIFTVDGLTVDLARRVVRVGPDRVQLTPTEYDLLRVLILHAGKVLTHRQLVREVWGGMAYEDSLHLVRVNISNLRHKLEADPARPRYILTEPGVGYRLETDGASEPPAPAG
jgi:two-component system, OmpR family, KDP operon response regulator KdpE